MKLRLLDLFSGIGGFSLGLERSGAFETVAFCEIEPFPRKVLAKHWPGVPCYEDVRILTAERLAADGIAVDAICGGFPCQDLSTCGPGGGLNGPRSGLWFEYERLIGEIRPSVIWVENSTEVLDGWLGVVLGALARLGYDAEWHCIPASAVGAPHKRNRWWLVAHAAGWGQPGPWERFEPCGSAADAFGEAGYAVDAFQRRALPFVCGSHDGLSGRVDELKSLGNAVVPDLVETIARSWLARVPTSPGASFDCPLPIPATREGCSK